MWLQTVVAGWSAESRCTIGIHQSYYPEVEVREGFKKKGKSMVFYQTRKLILLMVHIALQFV